MEIPSGMLCKAIAIVKVIPNFVLVLEVKYVAIPSGILCKIMANMAISPTLFKWFCWAGIFLSIIIDNMIPVTKEIIVINMHGNI